MAETNPIPKEEGMDHSLNLLREGYTFILNRRRGFNSNVFETRLLGKKAICMGGAEAAEVFYDESKFIRSGAAPQRLIETLFGQGGVQTLDDAAHRNRKQMFMSVMKPDDMQRLRDITKEQWDMALTKWEQMEKVVLYEEAQEITTRIACEWAGVLVAEQDVKTLSKDLTATFESPAAIGPSHWQGKHARKELEKWLIVLVNEIREGKLQVPDYTVFYKFSWHTDLNGDLLDPETVAVEIINILRPIVAISVYIAFVGLAVHHFPEEAAKVQSSDDETAQRFIQEVRRYYPFFPALVAQVREDFVWNGYEFPKDTMTLLDIYGTNHDPTLWDNPDVFNPDRFIDWHGSPFSFIPQGGGDYEMGHRCAGEWVTIEVMKISLDYLANRMKFDVPEQDLSYSVISMPSIPNSKLILTNVKRKMQ